MKYRFDVNGRISKDIVSWLYMQYDLHHEYDWRLISGLRESLPDDRGYSDIISVARFLIENETLAVEFKLRWSDYIYSDEDA